MSRSLLVLLLRGCRVRKHIQLFRVYERFRTQLGESIRLGANNWMQYPPFSLSLSLSLSLLWFLSLGRMYDSTALPISFYIYIPVDERLYCICKRYVVRLLVCLWKGTDWLLSWLVHEDVTSTLHDQIDRLIILFWRFTYSHDGIVNLYVIWYESQENLIMKDVSNY